ncbi:MAG TPA: glutamate synthase-related protein [Anaerolineales bacterium]|nr:glutamate synthase-related protein [Anaerolineales bacterium]
MTSDNHKYHRYHIETQKSEEIEKWPPRFRVKVGKIGLAKWLIAEFLEHGPQKMDVILSRPCMYGVFSGPIGGFAPRPQHCVACLRCTTENPEFISVTHNPDNHKLGDSYFNSEYINAIRYESMEGMIPVRGAGYRGKFGGEGWDGMWTDMSEIVRPTRDGIHGREFISTVVDIGYRPNFLVFDENNNMVGSQPQIVSIPLPILFDVPPASSAETTSQQITANAAKKLESLAVLPIDSMLSLNLTGEHLVPLVKPDQASLLKELGFTPRLVEMDGWNPHLLVAIQDCCPDAIIVLRSPFTSKEELLDYIHQGIHTFHFLADFQGEGKDGAFVLDLIRETHQHLVEAGIRQEATLIASGGMIAAEHIPKAILCGLDAVAIDTPIMAALQAKFNGEQKDRATSHFALPRKLTVEWGTQRLLNLAASWRDQLLEISGAMGLREIRRMRGEMGRAMFTKNLEANAFAGVTGYDRV